MRRRWQAIWFAIAVISPLAAQAAAPLPGFSSEIRAASAKLLEPSSGSADGLSAVRTLVDILARMAQADTRVPVTARTRLREASDAFRTGEGLEGNGVRLLHEAWKSMSGGTAFVFPPDVKDIPAATERCRIRIDACLVSLANGHGDRAVRELLEAVLMTVTPVQARGSRGAPFIRALWMLVLFASVIACCTSGAPAAGVQAAAGVKEEERADHAMRTTAPERAREDRWPAAWPGCRLFCRELPSRRDYNR